MHKIRKVFLKIKNNWILILILIIASLFRLLGTRYGYPPYHSDEGISYFAGISMVRNDNLDPLRYDYPTTVPLINFVFFKLIFIPIWWLFYYVNSIPQIIDGYLKLPLTEDVYGFTLFWKIYGQYDLNVLFWGRIVTALFGIGCVYLTYLLGKILLNRTVGYISAFLLAVNYRHVLNSHIGLPDIYNAFFLLLSYISAMRLREKPNIKNYLLAGLFLGFSFSTKYQLFSLIPILFVHTELSLKAVSLKDKIKVFFNPKIFVSVLVMLLIFILINPYHLIKYEETLAWVGSVSLKYGVGMNTFFTYPFVYLYQIGMGKIVSIFAVVGIIALTIKEKRNCLFLLSVLIPFFVTISFLTQGGFYTRNMITVVPLLLLFSGYSIYLFGKFIKIYATKLPLILIIVVISILSSWSNISNSYKVVHNYSKPWNFKILAQWLEKNIPEGSKVAANESVLLPIKDVKRVSYNFDTNFSVAEFAEQGATYAIADMDWETNDFYWWVKSPINAKIVYWWKPTEILENTYSAVALRELSDYAIYSVIKPWQSPDTNYIVATIPEIKINKKEIIVNHDFVNGIYGWQKTAHNAKEDISGLDYTNSGLLISGPSIYPDARWISPPIEVKDWNGIVVDSEMIATFPLPAKRGGYIYVSFYQNKYDAEKSSNRLGLILSKRASVNGIQTISAIGSIPQNAQWGVVNFQSYNPSQSTSLLKYVRIYKADITTEIGSRDIKPEKLDGNIIFPNSHGYL